MWGGIIPVMHFRRPGAENDGRGVLQCCRNAPLLASSITAQTGDCVRHAELQSLSNGENGREITPRLNIICRAGWRCRFER